jgi:hypothetical protein
MLSKKKSSLKKKSSSLAKIGVRMLRLESTLSVGKLFLLEKAKTLALGSLIKSLGKAPALGSLVKALDKPLVPRKALVFRKALVH